MRKAADPKIDQLADAELFRRCTPAELRRVASIADRVEVPAGRALCREGGRATECFVIVEGVAEVTVGGEVVAVLGAGQVVGEMAVIDQAGRSATVVARSQVVAYSIPVNRFDGLVERAPGVATGLLRQLTQRVRTLDAHVTSLAD